MKKALLGGLLGLLIGGAVMLFFSWVEGIFSFRLVPPRIESYEFSAQVALMLLQCLLAGAIAGGATSFSGRWAAGVVVGIVVGFGLGFLFVGQDDQPWGTIGALGMLLPVVFAGVLSGLAAAAVSMRYRVSAEINPDLPMKNIPTRNILQGFLPIDRTQIPADIIGGVTLAALAIPEVMGYTRIANMPVVTGLYTILIPMVLFALLGSSRHLVVGADSATAAIMAGGLANLAVAASLEYVAYAGVLALMTAILLLLARVIRLGFLADFLSHTVLIGFLTGVGISVAISGFAGILGIPGGGVGPLQQVITDFQQLGQTNFYTLGIAVAVIAIITGARRVNRKIPGALAAVIGAILVSYIFDLSKFGVAVLGPSPGDLPKIGLPEVSLNLTVFSQLLPISISMFIVILAQSAATSRAYATRYGEHLSENVDLVGLGFANLGAGFVRDLCGQRQPDQDPDGGQRRRAQPAGPNHHCGHRPAGLAVP